MNHFFRKSILLFFSLFSCLLIFGQEINIVNYNQITTGAQQFGEYQQLLKGKRVAIVANQASTVDKLHLIDFLLENEVNISKVFSPEHGFRGTASAGEIVDGETDSKTGLSIISLYGSHKKPSSADLENIDMMVFDLQDVGVRFYTYISTLTYVMEACAENNVPLIILDRPNPNGFYVDGPILENEYKSFVGLHPVPVVYGMTIGEYGKMVNGENWLEGRIKCDLTIIELRNYERDMIVELSTPPSPNLPNWQSVYLYPSLCFFEGTIVSVGRGTDFPFQIYGHPEFKLGSYTFKPRPKQGAKYPKLEGEQCYGQSLNGYAENYKNNQLGLNLVWLIESYKSLSKNNPDFFNKYFNTLVGNNKLKEQIEMGLTEDLIKQSWETDLNKFKRIRKKYLIYD